MIGREPLSVTSHLDIDFLRKPAAADVIADTALHKIGKRLAVGDVLMYSAGENVPCARASVTYAIPSVRLDPPRGVAATTSSPPTPHVSTSMSCTRFFSKESYWALGRTREEQARANDMSTCFSVLHEPTGAFVGLRTRLDRRRVVRMGGRRLRARRAPGARDRRVRDGVHRRRATATFHDSCSGPATRTACTPRSGSSRSSGSIAGWSAGTSRRTPGSIRDRATVAVTPARYPRRCRWNRRVGTAQVVRRAHPGAEAFVGRAVQRREEREAELDEPLAPGATRPVGRREAVRARGGARSVPAVLRARPRPGEALAALAAARREVPGVHRARKTITCARGSPMRSRSRRSPPASPASVGLCVPLTEAIALAHDCGHGPAGHASEEAFSPYVARRLRPRRLRRRRHARAAQPVRRDPRRRAQPLVAPARAVHPRGRGRRLGRPHRVRVPRLRGRGARRDPRPRRSARRGARRRRARPVRSRSARSSTRCSTRSTAPARSG